uniref:Uncharacterized protein n=1 Tax=Vespula pensylvanica TaxID=30213 RepID=A0A834NRN7_VESPE|nr:hypothetical protein H0235_011060 [Vespula pensylvanica]
MGQLNASELLTMQRLREEIRTAQESLIELEGIGTYLRLSYVVSPSLVLPRHFCEKEKEEEEEEEISGEHCSSTG